MIHEIEPERLFNEFSTEKPDASSTVFAFSEEGALIVHAPEGDRFPIASDFPDGQNMFYVLRLDEKPLFLAFPLSEDKLPANAEFIRLRNSSVSTSRGMHFAMMTAHHLWLWYRNNQYCGLCGAPTTHSTEERALICTDPSCSHITYPRISPAVIVAICNGDKLLLTRAALRPNIPFALVAGFCEIGETPEQTVAREAMEETGVRVKNIRYYKSQPWGLDGNLLIGYFADLDGDETITRDDGELLEAEWIAREDIEVDDDGYSLTREMIGAFKHNRVPV